MKPDGIDLLSENPMIKPKASQPCATVRKILRDVYELTMKGSCDNAAFDKALAKLREVDTLVEQHDLIEMAGDVAAHRGLVHHFRGTIRTMELDLDNAHADLATAHSCYNASSHPSDLVQRSRERILHSDDTRVSLLNALCVPCQSLLSAEQGRSVREHLSRALELVPSDLEWFQVCCDPCYRVVWEALSKARLGLMDDAWKAFWLAAHAEPLEEVPASLARYIRALHESEIMTQQAQRPRLELCRLAEATAMDLDDPLRAAYARCFVGNALRTMGGFDEARATLGKANEHCQGNLWTAGFLALVEGELAAQERKRPLALARFTAARSFYRRLDPHMIGLIHTAEGNFSFFAEEYEAAVQSFEAAYSALDQRRNPVLAHGALPINLAATLGALGLSTEARAALSRCDFDRSTHLGGAAAELFVTGCLALEEGGLEEALGCFREAGTRFDSLDRPRDKALASSYLVEAYARLGRRDQAIESAAEALQLFKALGCKQDTIEAFAKLRQQLAAAVMDCVATTASVRHLARAHGGWLP